LSRVKKVLRRGIQIEMGTNHSQATRGRPSTQRGYRPPGVKQAEKFSQKASNGKGEGKNEERETSDIDVRRLLYQTETKVEESC